MESARTLEDYRAVAKKLGVHYLFGRWGWQYGKTLGTFRRPRLVPLDGWVTDPKEIERIVRERGLEL